MDRSGQTGDLEFLFTATVYAFDAGSSDAVSMLTEGLYKMGLSIHHMIKNFGGRFM